MNVNIDFARLSDILESSEIMQYWYRVQDKSKGFLFGVPFTEKELQLMMDHKAIFVAKNEAVVLGYFLIDEITDNETTQMNKQLLDEIYDKDFFGYDKADLIPRAQIAVGPNCQENVSRKLMDFFKENYQGPKKAMFSIVARDNPNIHVHIRNGVEVVLQDERYYYVLFKLDQKGKCV